MAFLLGIHEVEKKGKKKKGFDFEHGQTLKKLSLESTFLRETRMKSLSVLIGVMTALQLHDWVVRLRIEKWYL